MDTLPWYDPVATYEESDLTSTLYVRQNPWKKSENVFEGVWHTRSLHVPHAHSRSACVAYLDNPEQFREKASRYARLVMDAPEWSISLVPNGGAGLLVRIRGGVNYGHLSNLAIATQMGIRTCGHQFVECGGSCEACEHSILEVLNITNTRALQSYLSQGHHIEPFYTLYRNVQILGRAAYHDQDGRRFAGMASAGIQKLFWKRRSGDEPTNPTQQG
jgi:hypothetical protein